MALGSQNRTSRMPCFIKLGTLVFASSANADLLSVIYFVDLGVVFKPRKYFGLAII